MGGIIAEIKKSDDLAKSPVHAKQGVRSKNKFWWVLGGGFCLLVLILVIFAGVLPFLSFFRSAADINIPSPRFSRSPAISSALPSSTPTQPTPTPTYAETSSSEAGQCQPLELVDSAPITIDSSDPGFKEDTDTHYYQVYGTTPYEVRAQLNECGAKSAGEAYDAYTSYYINWVYNYRPTAGGCAVYNVAVGAKIDFFYPKWEDPGNAQAGLAENWQRYMNNLIIHEEGHKDIAMTGALEIFNALSNLSTFANCEEAQSTADSTAQNIFDDHSTRNQAYDDETNHGQTQGATFP